MKTKKTQVKSLGLVILLLAMMGVMFIMTGCSNKEETATTEGTTEEVTEEVTEAPLAWDAEPAELDKTLYMDPEMDVEERVANLLSMMTLEEKAAQMVQAEQATITGPQKLVEYGLGSVLSGGGSAPYSGNAAVDWQTNTNNFKNATLASRLGIPLLYGVDAVHGHNNVYGATIFPHNIGLGATNDPELVEKIGEAVAAEVRATGIQWTFAPTLGNPQNELWGRTYECFGEEVDVVAEMGAAYVRGLQGDVGTDAYLDDAHVLATAKHYIGEGYTVAGMNQGNVKMDEAEFETLLREELLVPYKEALDAGARTVMVSFSSVNGLKTHEDSYLINEVLKGDLGFTGFVISDYNGVQQVSGSNYRERIAKSINAGVDMLMEPNSWEECMNEIIAAVKEGSISVERINDAVSRILRVKFEAGLFEEVVNSETEQALMESFGSEEHRAIAREAVSKSLVLLKNDKVGDKTVMEYLAESKNILVAGEKANDLGVQCGGWTISWQGSSGDITEGTTILEGLQQAAGAGVTIEYSVDGEVSANHDAVIVVIGETPYVESGGDRSATNLALLGKDKRTIEKIKETAAAAGKEDIPVIAIMISGRPVTIAEQIDDFDALVMAWLPGTEGQGVADVLLGDQDFTGTLKYTWTWYATDIAEKFAEGSEDKILFKSGSGLKKDGSSISADGTVSIGEKAELTDDEKEALEGNGIDLASVNYILEAENFTSDSYEVKTGNSNNIEYVENWNTEWANAKWDVWVPEAGNYRLHFKIAAAKDSNTVSIYYATPTIEDDGNANKTVVPMTATASLDDYEDFTLDVYLEKGNYQFKFMTDTTGGADFRLDNIEFEYLD